MSKLKLVPDRTKLELALERQEFEPNSDELIPFKIRMFYNKYLMDFIELNKDHDFLSKYEADVLKYLAELLHEGIMEDVSSLEEGLWN